MTDGREYVRQPVFLFDSATITPGTRRVTFDFSPPDDVDDSYERLSVLAEAELQEHMLRVPIGLEPFARALEVELQRSWVGVNIVTQWLVGSEWVGQPGDVDFILGNLGSDGTWDFSTIAAIQVKVCRVTKDDEPKIGPYGTKQTLGTVELGFDRVLLLHVLAQEQKDLPPGYASSWSGLANVPHPRVYERMLAKTEQVIQTDRTKWRFGYGILGCGQIRRSSPRSRGVFSPKILRLPPLIQIPRDSQKAKRRRKMISRIRNLVGERRRFHRGPVIFRHTKGRGRPTVEFKFQIHS